TKPQAGNPRRVDNFSRGNGGAVRHRPRERLNPSVGRQEEGNDPSDSWFLARKLKRPVRSFPPGKPLTGPARRRPVCAPARVVPHSVADKSFEPGRSLMPLVTVKLIEGFFTPTQKQEMVRKLTDAMVDIEGETMRSVTFVIVEEVKSGDWGIGGNPL